MVAHSATVDDEAIRNGLAADDEPAGCDGGTAGEEPVACCTWENTFGGQAVIEGVMMRGKRSWGLAVRRPSGGIARSAYRLESLSSRHRALKLPVIRGVVALYESLSLGIKALGMSANIGLEGSGGESGGSEVAVDEPSSAAEVTPAAEAIPATGELPAQPPAFGWKELTVTVVVAVGFAVALFIVIPLFVVKQFEETFSNPFVFNLVEGVIRIFIFIIYIAVISLIPDLRRVFMYHGAEHKVIHAYESSGRVDATGAARFSTRHPRCGTGFLLLVMVIAVFVFAIVGKPSLPWLVLSRIVGIPLIIGIAYEIGIKWAAKRPKGFFTRFLIWPGLQLQRLTTREPTPDQLEVAAAALEETIRMDESERAASAELAVQT